MPASYQNPGPSREEVDSMEGNVLLEFGTAWCGHCQGAAPHVSKVVAKYPTITHIKVEDGPGRRLGRSFGVKLWPTLVVLKDGQELARVVRPESQLEVEQGLAALDTPDSH